MCPHRNPAVAVLAGEARDALVVGFGALAVWVRWREGDLRLRESVAVPDLRGE